MEHEWNKEVAPTFKDEGLHGKSYEHPAFGQIVITKPSQGGDGRTLFGSELKHKTWISLEIKTAEVNRSLHYNRVHGRETITSVYLSEAQWAQMVSSIGNGSGTPCTIVVGPTADSKLEEKPLIAQESVTRVFDKEIEEKTKEYAARILDATTQLELLGESASIPKNKFKALVRDLRITLENLPGNMAFTQNQFKEVMEKVVGDSKIEVEAFIGQTIMQYGLEAMQVQFPRFEEIPAIEDQSTETVETKPREAA